MNRCNTTRATGNIGAHARSQTESKSKNGDESELIGRDVQCLGGRESEITHLLPLLERRIWDDIIHFRSATKARLGPTGKRYAVRLGAGKFIRIVSGNWFPGGTSSAVWRGIGRGWLTGNGGLAGRS